jgi:Acyl-CoA dehydrogenase, N-terminal domain
MEFSLSAEQRELKEAAAAFARAKLNQDLAKREEAGEFSLEAWQACARFGIQGLPVPAELGGGELSLRAWMSSLRGVDETAWFARDDLRPFGLICLRMGWRLAKAHSPALGSTSARPVSATGSAAPRPVLTGR